MSSFFRFLLVGVFNTCFGYGLIFAFMYLAEMSPELSNLLGYSVAIMVSFVLNKYFTFARKEPRAGTAAATDSRAELLRFLIVFACAYAANYAVLLLLIYKLEVAAGVSQLVAGVAYVGISWFLNKRFVFRYFEPDTTFMPRSNAAAETHAVFISRYTLPAIAALAILWMFFLRNALNGFTSFAISQDNEFFLGPVLSSMSASLRAGEWPLRMDTVLGGLPLYNFAQLTPFYPLYLLVLPLYESAVESMHSMHMIIVAHLLIMEINAYIFMRVIGAGRLPAVTAAALTTFSANNYNYAMWVNIIAPYAWFPLFLAGIASLAQGGPVRRSAGMIVVGITMLTLASPAQPFIHALLMAGIFCAFYYWHSRTSGDQHSFLRKFFWPLCGIGALGFLLVAPALLPAAVELKDMMRWVGASAPVYGTDRIPFAAFHAEQLALSDIGGVLLHFRGIAVGHQFVGIVLMGLAVIKIFSPRRTWMTNALLFAAVYSLLSSFGSDLGLAYINYWIPLLNKIREPSRFLFLFQFAICALAALALEELRQIADGKTGMRLAKRQWLALAALLVAGLLVRLFLPEHIAATIPAEVSLVVFCLLLALTWAMPRFVLPAKGLLLATCWGAVTLVTLAAEMPWGPGYVTRSDYANRNLAPLDDALGRVAQLDPAHDYRLIFDGSVDRQVAAMLASYHGIPTLNAYFNPMSREYFEELYYGLPRDDNYMRILGAKYLLCVGCPAAALTGYSFTENIAGYELYTADDAFPHSYVVTAVSGTFEHLTDFQVKAGQLPLDGTFLFVKSSGAPALQLPQEGDMAAAAVCSENEDYRGPTRVDITVDCNGPGVVIVNNLHDGNWSVSVDGVKTALLKVNGNQLGVQVVAGNHMVQFRYQPAIMTVTVVLSALSLLLLFYLFCGGRIGRWHLQR